MSNKDYYQSSYTGKQIDEAIHRILDGEVEQAAQRAEAAADNLKDKTNQIDSNTAALTQVKDDLDKLNEGGLVLKDEVIAEDINNWLNEHPEATTTVQKHSLTNDKLVIGTLGYVTPTMFDCIENGIANINKLQAMFDFAVANKLDVLFDCDFDFLFVPGSTINNPTRVLIKRCDGMTVDGGGHTVTMKGLSKDYLDSLEDSASSGRDIFTFLSFTICNNISVRNLKVKGDYIFDLDIKFKYTSPRAKAIGFVGTSYSTVSGCNFDGILGNGVNLTPSSNELDGEWAACYYCKILNCYASNCLENGFNNMGGTSFIQYDGVTCRYCHGGIETGTGRNIISNSGFYSCKNGIAFGGIDVCSNCVTEKSSLYFNSSHTIVLDNCIINANRMIHVLPGSGPIFLNNCVLDAVNDEYWKSDYNCLFYAVGQENKIIERITFNGCRIMVGTRPMNFNRLENLSFIGCDIIADSGNIINMYNTGNSIMVGTLYHGGIVGTFTDGNIKTQ